MQLQTKELQGRQTDTDHPREPLNNIADQSSYSDFLAQ